MSHQSLIYLRALATWEGVLKELMWHGIDRDELIKTYFFGAGRGVLLTHDGQHNHWQQ